MNTHFYKMKHKRKQTTNEFILELIRQNDEILRDTKMEEELEELIFQEMAENYFYDDEERMKLNNHKRKNTI